MSERRELSGRLLFAIPAGLLATLTIFALVRYMAGTDDAKLSAGLHTMTLHPAPSVASMEPEIIIRCDCASLPEAPSFARPFPTDTGRREIRHDRNAVRKLLAEPDRPRSANWILLKGARPQYPPEALKKGMPGHAVLEFTIDERGRAGNVRIVEQTAPAFGRAARRAVRDWLFIPRRESGKAVTSQTVRLRIEFRLED